MKFGHDLAKVRRPRVPRLPRMPKPRPRARAPDARTREDPTVASQVVNVSDPEWAPYFIQYKTLKQHIKAIRAETDANGSQDGSPCRSAGGDSSQAGSPAPAGRARATTEDRAGLEDTGAPAAQRKTMSESAPEVAFFRALRAELQKSSKFFTSAEHVLEIRRERVHEALRMLKRAAEPCGALCKPGLLEDDDARALAACVAYYRDLLLLENYAIINYCGFSKILKKHDKRTGFATRSQFMRICVAPQPFTLHPRLLDMIKEAEDLYKEMGAAAKAARDDRAARSAQAAGEPPKPAAAAPTSPPCPRDESDFIDAILNLRTETSKIRAAEDLRATAGDTPPPTGDGAAFPFASVSPARPAPNAAAVAASPPFPVLVDRAADGDAPAAKRQKA